MTISSKKVATRWMKEPGFKEASDPLDLDHLSFR